MTKEHVPPKSAFNDRGYLQYYADATEKAELQQWRTREVNATGIFVFTLCQRCNNKTGHSYGQAYVDFVKSFVSIATPDNAERDVRISISVFPLRVVKQAVSMILSTSEPTAFRGYEAVCNPFARMDDAQPRRGVLGKRPDAVTLQEIYDALRSFVRRRDQTGLPPSVRLYAYATVNSGSGVHTGILGTGSLSRRKTFWGAVVGLWPIHWVLALAGEPLDPLLDLTGWADEAYRQNRNVDLVMPCKWTFAKYPLDFRSPNKFMRDGFLSRMRVEGHIPDALDEDDRFEAAIRFARRRGKTTTSGLFLRQFGMGTYAEHHGHRLWFEGRRLKEVQAYLEAKDKADKKESSGS